MLQSNFLDYLRSFLTDKRNRRFDDVLDLRTRHLTVALENVYHSHNASAALRSCDAFGIQDVHVVESETEFQVDREIALGSSKWLTIHRYEGGEDATAECIEALRERGYQVVATTPHAPEQSTLENYDVSQKTALLVGGELRGLSGPALELADCSLKIPMCGFTESFNLSVSVAIMLYDLTTKLRGSDVCWRLSNEERNELLHAWCRRALAKRYDALRREWEAQNP